VSGTQLRRYEIKPGEMDVFLAAWRGILPIRERYGFRVGFAYVNDAQYEFVWTVTHDGDFEAAERDYYGSPERATLVDNPADHIAVMHVDMVRAADTGA
jgi:hypothetical protein